jgi:hypothetical protein
MNKILMGFGILLAAGLLVWWRMPTTQQSSDGINRAVVYKSPTCGCCVKHVAFLREHGFEVEVKQVNDMAVIKNKHNIASDMESCHTTIIGDYFVEGHVPMEAINKLVTERPAIDGIALPGMPAGSPGMPGVKVAPFEIFSLTEGKVSQFLTL